MNYNEVKARYEAWNKSFDKRFVKGFMQGTRETMSDVFCRQAKTKFRTVPKGMEKRVHEATLEQIDTWLGRILTADSLDEVFEKPVKSGAFADDLMIRCTRKRESAKAKMSYPAAWIYRQEYVKCFAKGFLETYEGDQRDAKIKVFLRLAPMVLRVVPKWVEERLCDASDGQIDIWLERLPTASVLKDVFDKPGKN